MNLMNLSTTHPRHRRAASRPSSHSPSCRGAQDAVGMPCTGMGSNFALVSFHWRQFIYPWQRGREGALRGQWGVRWGQALTAVSRSCRMSATQCLKHEWLSDLPAKAQKCRLRLKSQLLLQSYMAHRKWKVNKCTKAVKSAATGTIGTRRAEPFPPLVWCPQASWLYQLWSLFLPVKEEFCPAKEYCFYFYQVLFQFSCWLVFRSFLHLSFYTFRGFRWYFLLKVHSL